MIHDWAWLRVLLIAISVVFAVSVAVNVVRALSDGGRDRRDECARCQWWSPYAPCECPRGEPCRSPSCPRRSDREVMR